MLRARNEIMVRQSNLIFLMHKQRSCFFTAVIQIDTLALSSIEGKVTSSDPKIAATSSNAG